MSKERLDLLLVKKGFFESREKARGSIMAGVVFVNGNKEDKPGAKFLEDNIDIEIKENINPYVSRGGLKLEKAINIFNLDIKGKTAIDIGASTGGFTDCMLKNGASKVFCIDVGYGQLAWILRNDKRVVVMERTNIRYVQPSQLGVLVDFITIDVSFISLKKVIPTAIKLSNEDAKLICLIKPQFEAGRDKVSKHGVVREPKIHEEVINDIISFSKEIGLYIKGISFSPIKGPEGNIEYLLYLSKKYHNNSVENNLADKISDIVKKSHENL